MYASCALLYNEINEKAKKNKKQNIHTYMYRNTDANTCIQTKNKGPRIIKTKKKRRAKKPIVDYWAAGEVENDENRERSRATRE